MGSALGLETRSVIEMVPVLVPVLATWMDSPMASALALVLETGSERGQEPGNYSDSSTMVLCLAGLDPSNTPSPHNRFP